MSLVFNLVDRFFLSNITMIFSYLFFGNLIDNTGDYRNLITYCNLALASFYMLYGVIILIDNRRDE